MQDLGKNDELTVRMQRRFRRKLDRAARVLTIERQRPVKAGPLLLELAEPGLDRILSQDDRRIAERRSA